MVNIVKNLFSYLWSNVTGRIFVWGVPSFVSMEPTSFCNLHCPECPAGTNELNRQNGFQTLETFKSILNPIRNDTLGLLLYFQGEPFLNKDIYAMISYARSQGLYVVISTNGHFFTNPDDARHLINSGLNSLIISLDGTTQEKYSKYRIGGSLKTVIEGMEHIISIRKSLKKRLPRIYVQFLVMRHNEHQMMDAKILAEKIGADKILYKAMQIIHKEGISFLPALDIYRRYDKTNGKLQIRNKTINKCIRLWTGAVVTWDGMVVPCCYDKHAAHVFGTVNIGAGVSIQDIWRSAYAISFRQKVITSGKSIAMCTECSG